MVPLPRHPARTISLAAVAAVALTAPASAQAAPKRLPVYEVKSAGVDEGQAARLAEDLGLEARLRGEDGGLAFLDEDRFGFLPVRELPAPQPDEEGAEVVAQAPDLDAIAQLEPLAGDEALARATRALELAGLPYDGKGRVSHSHFDAVDADGNPTVSADVDTHVSFRARLGELPLIGPGAKAKLVFDADGRVTFLRYARRELAEGDAVSLLSRKAADRLARRRFTSGCPGRQPVTDLKLTRRLVYYAPSLGLGTAEQILPHYDYGARATVGGERVRLERVLIPAVAQSAPRVALTASADGEQVTAQTSVKGGKGPYTFRYGSCATTLSDEAAGGGEQISYLVRSREGGPSTVTDKVTVTVTDANGLTATASARVGVAAIAAKQQRARARASVGGRVDVATEWIGNTQGLPNSSSNTADFRDEMEDVSTVAFNWGDNNVFESDFVDPSSGGDDSSWADNVDLMWFQGHGNADGFATGATQGDGWVDKSEARWGNTDLEWLVVHSCDVLALGSGATHVWNRWRPAFAGLHMLLGYGNSSYNVDGDGNEFGDDLADDDMRIRSAWVDANESEQPDGVIYRYMGVFGPNGEWNRDDYFHGIGSVSGDITSVSGAWSYTGTV